jgi:pimeloyl-ACP methyl ester carboxylesterase
MTTVFVHGVPETAAIWDRLRAALDRESIVLSLPGFGVPRPEGFGATQDEYVEWLVGQLSALDGPVDLVGHDWGGILTARLVTTDAVPLHSWVSDAVGAVSPSFVWHDLAKVWQTPGDGEAFFAGLMADRVEAAGLLAAVGVPPADATVMAEALDQTMVDSILDLYRSSTTLGQDWGHEGPAMANGLVLVGGADALGDVAGSQTKADLMGAQFTALDGGGHWWPLDSTDAAAQRLETFWSGLA